MSVIGELFGRSPFGSLVEHTKKVHECVKVIKPLAQALVNENREEIHRLQDQVSKVEYEADRIKHEIRENLPRRYFLPVYRDELDTFLRCQDRIADSVEDFAVILFIRDTSLHATLKEPFVEFAEQVVKVSEMLLGAADELQNLAEAAFGGAEAKSVLDRIVGLGEEEWKADRMQRALCRKIYSVEKELDPITIVFYDKMLQALSRIANEAENTGDLLRAMIVKG
ncbi:MAG: TIGR00153 family protein [Kiritimatiellia bacterium]